MNKKNPYILISLLLLIIPLYSQENSYLDVFNQLIDIPNGKCFETTIKNFELHRDVANFKLTNGKLYLLSPVNERIVAAFFDGDGEFTFSPSTELEKIQLNRFFKTSSFKTKIKKLFFFVTDSTIAQFKQHFNFQEVNLHKKNKKVVETCLLYFTNSKLKSADSEILLTLLEEVNSGLFYGHIINEKKEPYLFRIHPNMEEEIKFYRALKTSSFLHRFELINSFNQLQDIQNNLDYTKENKERFHVKKHKLMCEIDEDLHFTAYDNIELSPLVSDEKWLPLMISPKIKIDSIKNENNEKLDYFKPPKNSIFWVLCKNPLVRNQSKQLSIYYNGKILQKQPGWIYNTETIRWYPSNDYHFRSMFDITFTTPPEYQFLCVGEKISEIKDAEYMKTNWVSHKPIRNASFHIGKLKKQVIRDERIPEVSVFTSEEGHKIMRNQPGGWQLYVGKDMRKDVLADITNGLSFCQYVFGDSPIKHFYAVDIPATHGEAFPGMIHLSSLTFKNIKVPGFHELFRAHEVAHQWWGIEVDYLTYHDRWLSEGFAQFTGLWYTQAILHNNEQYFKFLREWKDELTGERNYLFQEGIEAGPIYLGNRVNSRDTAEDQYLILYLKGAWIIHMLRNMMLDLNNMNDEKFISMFRDFYSSNRGKQISTEDFKRTVEKHLNMDMDWFFNQWVYGNEIPEYKFTYEIKKTLKSKYYIQCKVEQTDVSPEFQMPVVIAIEFKNKQFAYARKWIKGSVQEFNFPETQREPQKVIFNEFESVLCKLKTKNLTSFYNK
jgi:hypothetical protein